MTGNKSCVNVLRYIQFLNNFLQHGVLKRNVRKNFKTEDLNRIYTINILI